VIQGFAASPENYMALGGFACQPALDHGLGSAEHGVGKDRRTHSAKTAAWSSPEFGLRFGPSILSTRALFASALRHGKKCRHECRHGRLERPLHVDAPGSDGCITIHQQTFRIVIESLREIHFHHTGSLYY
jgi:hypothetical protein